MLHRFLTIIVFAFCIFINVKAQTGRVSHVRKVTAFKPPVVTTSLDAKGSKGIITSDEAKIIIGEKLIVTDSKKIKYTVTSYQFLYKRKSSFEDSSGNRHESFTTLADIFTTSPLPEMWVNKIKNELKPGEELYFFDVIVEDAAHKKFFAPDLKLKIK